MYYVILECGHCGRRVKFPLAKERKIYVCPQCGRNINTWDTETKNAKTRIDC
jgi:DNA-directed RNA polymerase subunit RPC12/RpoP